MYVCHCAGPKGLTEKDVRDAVRAGAKCRSDVYKHHDTRPSCGICTKHMNEVMAATKAEMAAEKGDRQGTLRITPQPTE
ncbi:MAG: (2Fe-2S)-binding protein [Proteobacteria bacterium]|nr:(2Fe-2S)-binding protein [Pseudomonadota bacterium]